MLSADDLTAIAATEVERMRRMARIGELDTAGPDVHPPELADPQPHPPAPRWKDGWWAGARFVEAHAGRVGGPIRAWSTVVHTTDMLPDEWAALVTAWTTRAGEGACAHFLIGRDAAHGVVQLIPINRNGNHAGGPGHGVYRTHDGHDLHPNLVSVGIEVHCAGGVVLVAGQWRLVENRVAHGAPIPAADVVPDPARPGRGWHIVTDYQREQLFALLEDLDAVRAQPLDPCTKVAFGETPPSYAVLPTPYVATHAELDPQHRADPWPPLSAELRALRAR